MKKTLLILSALACLVVTGVPALAASWRPFKVTGTLHFVSGKHVKSNGDGDYVVRGPVTSSRLGRGTATYTSTVQGGAVRGTVVVTFKGGTVKTAMRGRFTLAPHGSVLGRTTGTGQIVGGTGAYAGVRGRFSFTGVSYTNATTAMTITGRVRSPVR